MSTRPVSNKPGIASSLTPVLRVALFVVLLAAPMLAAPRSGVSRGADLALKDLPSGAPLQTSEHLTYLPCILRDYSPPSYRLGYGAVSAPITQYSDVHQLKAGWYLDWGTRASPVHPPGMDYVQTVRLHQVTECWPDRLRDREQCPYVTPYTYTLTSPGSRESLVSVAEANPGSLWLIGNEMDRYDWGGINPYNPSLGDPDSSGGQDEMLPELYAEAYHELYHFIKATDPTAQVAIGGIIQATPARLEYLTKIWDTYQTLYGEDMPVDVWNVHNFIFKEKCDDYGADIPPGCKAGDGRGECRPFDVEDHPREGDPCYGTLYHDHPDRDATHASMEIFEQQIVRFREWMKDHDQQEKPLIVSEYGVLYFHPWSEEELPEVTEDFMLDTFDYFMTAPHPDLGCPADGYRLVQRWAWYSLDDDWKATSFNKYGVLIDRYEEDYPYLPIEGGRITTLGQAFADYASNYLDRP